MIDGDGVISDVRTAGHEEDDRAYRRKRASEQRYGERAREQEDTGVAARRWEGTARVAGKVVLRRCRNSSSVPSTEGVRGSAR
jgi:hypothetical protein